MRIIFQRVSKPPPFPIFLGNLAKLESGENGVVTGIVVAPDDGLGGFFVELTVPDMWSGVPEKFPET